MTFIATLTVLLSLTASQAQVSHQIYSMTDLMATDTVSRGRRVEVTVAPPPEFLSSLTQTVFLPTPLPSRQAPRSLHRGSLDRGSNISNRRNRDGSYSFSYSTTNGMARSETGSLTDSGWGVVGSYQYRGQDGALYRVTFTADQNGYRPRVSKVSAEGQSGTDFPPRRRRQRHLYRNKLTVKPVRKYRRKRMKMKRLV